ncbi:hypothetical protein L218DRAFT_406923 [Marasmius fiardii PR-910]|nr:hypothetical protein L218DRAFT_406923 [Marasmius fiardii PR-910]
MTNSTSPAMQILAGASGVLINQSHFSNIEGNQYNYYMTDKTQSKKKTITGDLLELSEFTQVKRGDIYKDRDVCYSWRLCSNGKDETEAAVYYAEINIAGSFGQKKFTVKAYHGRNAKKEWRRDFLRCSTNEDVPLFGYNQSSVPSLIFYGELIPMALIVEGLGLVGHLYIAILRTALECSTSELWMDPTKGGFCRGPAGPQCRDQVGDFRGIAIPSDVEFLKEDVLIRYLSNTKHDGGLLWALNYSGHFETGKEISPPYYPQIISSLTNSTMAFTRNVQWSSWKDCLCDRSIMADGMTRFLLRNKRRSIEVKSAGVTSSWLSQAFHVFHAHNIQSQDFSRFSK